MAVMSMKELRKAGELGALEVSREINACSIMVDAKMEDGTVEPWLVMFKNETHNHPTEIEPFGGAATCLGGCIRDPLSGRSYVYQAMRVSGAADPRTTLEDTLKGKLPQRKICVEAAHGYSSYGNQIGLATGSVTEVYHDNYVAKRMEIGAVIAGAPHENVFRGEPKAGDYIVL
ncbi:MAG: phosphoribosylformylglycinamidine synthase, partial [bacterium]|nr:phosphoribosylformylglycinamidine synthase [bacterium]